MSAARRFFVYHLPMILYAGMIIALSSIPHLRGPSLGIPAADKIIHGIEYGIFALLVIRSFLTLSHGHRFTVVLAAAALFTSAFAVFDEYYQRTVPGRQFDLLDMMADIAGSLLVILILIIRRRRQERLVGQSNWNPP